MPNKIFLILEGHEFEALLKSAVIDMREPRDEARFILRQEFARRGLLQNLGNQLCLENRPADNTEKIVGK